MQQIRHGEMLRVIEVRDGEGFQPHDLFLGQVQRYATRCQYRQLRGGTAERLHEARTRLRQMFTIIQDEEHLLVMQIIHNGARRGAPGRRWPRR